MSIELIRAKQQELAAAKLAEEDRTKKREQAEIAAFAATGILSIWEQIKHLKVPYLHQHTNGEQENNDNRTFIPLEKLAVRVTPTSLYLADWDGAVKVAWYARTTDTGDVRFVVGGRDRLVGDYHTAEQIRNHFVKYMANLLPPLEETDV